MGRLRKNVSWAERIITCFSLSFVLLKALRIVIKVNPSLVIGTGGAVSGPVLLAGFLLRKRTLIFEFNIVPGLTNRFLSRIVDEAIVVFSSTKEYLKVKKQTVFPFPVRSRIARISMKNQNDSPLRVLVLGGSQGSAIINKVVSELVVSDEAHFFSFVHQTGEKEVESLERKYLGCGNVKIFSFLDNIHKVYEWADVVIGRAGIGTIAEISSAGRAGILVPLSSSADQHQLKNAQGLEKKSAIILIEEKDFTTEKLKEVLRDLVNQPQKIKWLSSCIQELKLGSTADNISSYLLKRFF